MIRKEKVYKFTWNDLSIIGVVPYYLGILLFLGWRGTCLSVRRRELDGNKSARSSEQPNTLKTIGDIENDGH